MKIKFRILVVDDDNDLLEVVSDFFKMSGYVVDCATNREEAISLAAQKNYDIALVDMKLADTSGYEVVEKIAAISSKTKFIYITGSASLSGAINAVKQKYVVAYETKPLDFQHLLQVVAQTTQRITIETALKKSKERYALATSAGQVGVWEWLIDEDTLLFGSNLKAMLGYNANNTSHHPKDWRKNIHPDDLSHVNSELKAHLVGQTAHYEVTFRAFHKNGSIRWLLTRGTVVQDEMENPHRIVGTGIDITKRKQAEEALKQSEERFRQVITSISDHIYVTDVTENGYYINNYHSDHIETLTGYPKEMFTADWYFWSSNVIHPDDKLLAAQQSANLLNGEDSEIEYRIIRSDGTVLWVRDSARIEYRGNTRVIYGIISNITDRKELEKAQQANAEQLEEAYKQNLIYAEELHEKISELKQARIDLEKERALLAKRVEERTAELTASNIELARTAKYKDEFLANMSHELRTPLNTVLGLTNALKEGVYGGQKQEQLETLDRIEQSGQHLLDLITNILNLAKIGARKLELEIEAVPVGLICQLCLDFIKEPAYKKNIEVNYKFDDKVTVIQADELRLKQILINLLSNAVKFTPNGGKVSLEVVGDESENLIHFIVSDTGVGITQKEMPLLFKPFMQLNNNLTKQQEGAGLGLALVHSLAELHGGGVSVESEAGQGSCFTVSFIWHKLEPEKIDQIEETTNTIADEPSFDRASRSILLVEDNEFNITIIVDFLTFKGYNVHVARNGVEAINLASERHPHLILMDIHMPVLDGLSAIKRLRADSNLKTIPIVALTALAMPGDRERILESGADAYLSKPINLKELLDTLDTQLKEKV